jgi:hypothetical protein
VLSAAPGAKVALGLKRQLTPQQLREAIAAWIEAQAGAAHRRTALRRPNRVEFSCFVCDFFACHNYQTDCYYSCPGQTPPAEAEALPARAWTPLVRRPPYIVQTALRGDCLQLDESAHAIDDRRYAARTNPRFRLSFLITLSR